MPNPNRDDPPIFPIQDETSTDAGAEQPITPSDFIWYDRPSDTAASEHVQYVEVTPSVRPYAEMLDQLERHRARRRQRPRPAPEPAAIEPVPEPPITPTTAVENSPAFITITRREYRDMAECSAIADRVFWLEGRRMSEAQCHRDRTGDIVLHVVNHYAQRDLRRNSGVGYADLLLQIYHALENHPRPAPWAMDNKGNLYAPGEGNRVIGQFLQPQPVTLKANRDRLLVERAPQLFEVCRALMQLEKNEYGEKPHTDAMALAAEALRGLLDEE